MYTSLYAQPRAGDTVIILDSLYVLPSGIGSLDQKFRLIRHSQKHHANQPALRQFKRFMFQHSLNDAEICLTDSPCDLVFLAVRLPLLVRAHLAEGELEGGRHRNHDGAGVVLVDVLLDLEQPAKNHAQFKTDLE